MKNKISYRRGFTLIELLVVVLIIGILASIALPQYQKAVTKSRFSEAMSNLRTIYQANRVCFMENTEGCSLEDLSVNIGKVPNPCPFTLDGECAARETEHFTYLGGDYVQGVCGSDRPVVGAQYKDDDVCICFDGEGFALAYNWCKDGTTTDYTRILRIPEDPDRCGCC